jgi:endonuclease YncB( thermonuclease family)
LDQNYFGQRAMRYFPRITLFCLLAGTAVALATAARSDPRSVECGGKRTDAVAGGAIDAVTLRLADGTEVKLGGVIGPSAVDGDDAAEALALSALRKLSDGKKLAIFAAEGKDRYGRMPARAVLIENEIWLEAAMIELGLLRVLPTGNEACAKALLAIEQKARAAQVGLWTEKKFQIFVAADVPALTEALGRFAVVEGTIRRVGDTKARLYLDFGRRFTEDFTIVVPNAVRNSLVTKGLDPKNWRGKRVRVRGVLVSWGGPAIEINATTAIELLDSDIPEKADDR